MATHIPRHIKGKTARHKYAVELMEDLAKSFDDSAKHHVDSTYRTHSGGCAQAYKDALEILREIAQEGE